METLTQRIFKVPVWEKTKICDGVLSRYLRESRWFKLRQFVVFISIFLGLQGVGQAQNLQDSFTVYLVRHAEKALSFNLFNPPLTQCGGLRAERLASMLKGIALEKVYSSDFQRTLNTASPTASLQGLNVELYDPHKLEAFSQLLLDRKQDALVVGHSQSTSVLAGLLVGEKRSALDESIYDRMYQGVVVNGQGRIHLLHQAFQCDE